MGASVRVERDSSVKKQHFLSFLETQILNFKLVAKAGPAANSGQNSACRASMRQEVKRAIFRKFQKY